jgi:hypothetical protein
MAASSWREQIHALIDAPDLPPQVLRTILAAIGDGRKDHWFVQLRPRKFREAVRAIRQHCERPWVALDLLAVCMDHLDFRSQQVRLSRHQLAEAVGVNPARITEIMAELDHLGLVRRAKEGRESVYFLTDILVSRQPRPKRPRQPELPFSQQIAA